MIESTRPVINPHTERQSFDSIVWTVARVAHPQCPMASVRLHVHATMRPATKPQQLHRLPIAVRNKRCYMFWICSATLYYAFDVIIVCNFHWLWICKRCGQNGRAKCAQSMNSSTFAFKLCRMVCRIVNCTYTLIYAPIVSPRRICRLWIAFHEWNCTNSIVYR